MKQDEHLKMLLAKHAVEQTADDFTAKTMQRINGEAASSSKTFLAGSFRVKQLLIILFIVATLALVIISSSLKPLQLPVEIRLELPAFFVRHFYHFFILIPAFWVLVFINYRYERSVRV